MPSVLHRGLLLLTSAATCLLPVALRAQATADVVVGVSRNYYEEILPVSPVVGVAFRNRMPEGVLLGVAVSLTRVGGHLFCPGFCDPDALEVHDWEGVWRAELGYEADWEPVRPRAYLTAGSTFSTEPRSGQVVGGGVGAQVGFGTSAHVALDVVYFRDNRYRFVDPGSWQVLIGLGRRLPG